MIVRSMFADDQQQTCMHKQAYITYEYVCNEETFVALKRKHIYLISDMPFGFSCVNRFFGAKDNKSTHVTIFK
jgi:hypothetical protein